MGHFLSLALCRDFIVPTVVGALSFFITGRLFFRKLLAFCLQQLVKPGFFALASFCLTKAIDMLAKDLRSVFGELISRLDHSLDAADLVGCEVLSKRANIKPPSEF